ncbi:hypothetical protein NC653_037821 [Populus alba x Populus x berolinensis]|uniref:Uncharacterized protein n=1 Tax=Populus alba x Populus x berolinensis TaxID=444605 RepID=A0AAD6LHV5_9ROSI|nr:hypothetical protein NC653_037821 [Populus alba x Populus x berolinensis]
MTKVFASKQPEVALLSTFIHPTLKDGEERSTEASLRRLTTFSITSSNGLVFDSKDLENVPCFVSGREDGKSGERIWREARYRRQVLLPCMGKREEERVKKENPKNTTFTARRAGIKKERGGE